MMGSIIDKRERTRRRLFRISLSSLAMRGSAWLADALLVWGQWQTDAWLTVEFGFLYWATQRRTAVSPRFSS